MKDAKWAFKVACMSETLTDDFHFVKDIQGNNTIHYAAYRCEYESINNFINDNKYLPYGVFLNVKGRNKFNMTPLHLACRSDSALKTRQAKRLRLTSSGPEVEYFTPTFEALLSTIKLLIEYGAELDAKDIFGKTPLDYSTRIKNKNALFNHILLKHDLEFIFCVIRNKVMDVNMVDENGNTALHHACMDVNNSAISCLINFKADVNKKNNAEDTPLHLLCKAKDKTPAYLINFNLHKAVLYLLRFGAVTYLRDKLRNTAIHYECRKITKSNRIFIEYDVINIINLIKYSAMLSESDLEGMSIQNAKCLLDELSYKKTLDSLLSHEYSYMIYYNYYENCKNVIQDYIKEIEYYKIHNGSEISQYLKNVINIKEKQRIQCVFLCFESIVKDKKIDFPIPKTLIDKILFLMCYDDHEHSKF